MFWNKKPQTNLFSTRDEAFHRSQKRPVAHAYSLSALLELEPAVDSCSALFLAQLRRFAADNKPIDLGIWLQYYAFDVVGEFSFASKLGFLEQGADVDGMSAPSRACSSTPRSVARSPKRIRSSSATRSPRTCSRAWSPGTRSCSSL